MTQENLSKVRRMVHAHTARCLFDYSNDGHGTDVKKALKSAFRLVDRKAADAIAEERR